MIHQLGHEDCGCGGGCGGRGGAQLAARGTADPAARKAALYALLAAAGWVLDSKWALAVGVGGLIGAAVDMASNNERGGG
jgi:hypothetical protein